MFNMDATNDEGDYEQLRQSINPIYDEEEDTGTTIKKKKMTDDGAKFKISLGGSTMMRSNTIVPESARS